MVQTPGSRRMEWKYSSERIRSPRSSVFMWIRCYSRVATHRFGGVIGCKSATSAGGTADNSPGLRVLGTKGSAARVPEARLTIAQDFESWERRGRLPECRRHG